MTVQVLTILCMILTIWIIALVVWHMRSTAKNKEIVNEANARIARVEQSRNELMSNLSHELRTPINTIMGMSELLSEGDLDAQMRIQVQAVQSTGRELLTKISDLLDYAQITSNDAIKIQEESYLISSTISDVVSDYLEPISAKGIELVIDLDTSVPAELIGDEPKLRRVMINILSNAVKFTTSGCIAIHISARKEQYGVNLRFEVRDTGKGMKQEEINSLFEAFYQGDSSLTRSVGGIGLGLAISFAIIQSMGGFLTVSSELEKGTRIAFTVPQRVLNDKSVYQFEGKNIKPTLFLDFEKYASPAVREEYKQMISGMSSHCAIPFQLCRNITELKRFKPGKNITHLLVGLEEYLDNEQFVTNLAELIPIAVVVPRGYKLQNPGNLQVMMKPIYGLAIVNFLNGKGSTDLFQNPLRDGLVFKAPGVRALVVDDNRMNLVVMHGLLNKYDIEADSALSGFEAIQMMDMKVYDFIFMDHMMPEMDGVETLRRIRQRPDSYSRDIPVVAVSANATGNAKDRYLNAGFVDFIPKPIDKLTLDTVLRKLIPAARRKVVEDGEIVTEEPLAPVTIETPEQLEALTIDETAATEEATIENTATTEDTATPFGDFAFSSKDLEIDMEQALMFCADDKELYFEIVDSYIEESVETREKLQRLYAQEDWKNYAVTIHALKGTSRTIGAMALGNRAERLEKAAKEVAGIDDVTGTGGLSTLKAEHESCLALYEAMISKLGDLKA